MIAKINDLNAMIVQQAKTIMDYQSGTTSGSNVVGHLRSMTVTSPESAIDTLSQASTNVSIRKTKRKIHYPIVMDVMPDNLACEPKVSFYTDL